MSFAAAPNFEAPSDADRDNVYELVVSVADGNGGSATQAIAVAVSGVNEAPVMSAPAAVLLAQQAPAGTVLAIVTASDPDAGDLFTFTLLADGGGRFVIDPASGRLQVAPGAMLNLQSGASHTLILRVTDAQGLRTEQAIVVNLRGIAEPPGGIVLPELTPPAVPAAPPGPVAGIDFVAPPAATTSDTSTRDEGREDAAARPAPANGSSAGAAEFADLQDGELRGPGQRARYAADGASGLAATVSFVFNAIGGGGDWSDGNLDDLLLRQVSDALSQRSGLFSLRGSSIDVDSADDALRAAGRGAEQALMAALQDPVRVASATLTAGFVWWLTRSGGLLTSILMGIPAWRHVDLLPVLAPARDDDEEDDDAASGSDAQHAEPRVTQRDSMLDDLFSNTSRMFGESRYL